MKYRTTIYLLPLIAACGGGDGSAPLPVDDINGRFNPAGPVVNACASPYYQELQGAFDGQISFDDGATVCVFEVEAEILGDYSLDPVRHTVCNLDIALHTELVSGNGSCANITVVAGLDDALKSPTDSAMWIDTPWPITAYGILPVAPPQQMVTAVVVGSANVFQLIFDGNGNIMVPEIHYAGVLVKQ